MDSLRDTAKHVEKHDNHEDVKRDVEEMNGLFKAWHTYIHTIDDWNMEDPYEPLMNLEEQAWKDFHSVLEQKARNWWD